jgi:hypothetical protein
MRPLSVFAPLLLCLGCASYSGSSLKPGIATPADTRALMGAPFAVHKAASGADYAISWEYPHGPMGRYTYMVRFDARERLLRIDQVLQVANVRALTIGLSTHDDVRDLFGRPGIITAKDYQGLESWDYFAIENLRNIIIRVAFDADGRVRTAGEAPDPTGESGGRGRFGGRH